MVLDTGRVILDHLRTEIVTKWLCPKFQLHYGKGEGDTSPGPHVHTVDVDMQTTSLNQRTKRQSCKEYPSCCGTGECTG